MGLPYGEEIMIVGRTMWTQSTSVTDRQTNGRTELITITKTVQRIASHGNKKLSYCSETVRRESMPRIAEMDAEMTTYAEWPSKMYFKVIKSGTNRKLLYDFPLDVYSNFCRITHRFWEILCERVQWPWNMPTESCRMAMYVKCSEDSERMKRKSPFSTSPLSFDAPSPANPREYLHKRYTARNYVPWATLLTVYG